MSEMRIRPALLVVDDEPDNFAVVAALLSNEKYDLHFAATAAEGVALAESLDPDLILMDFMMPDKSGAEVCSHLKANDRTRSIPIIMVTALAGKESLAHCLMSGADDFIGKPVAGLELRARIRSMLRIRHQHRENENLLHQLKCLNSELQAFNQRLDLQVQERTAELQRLILFHSLTGLASRNLLLQRIWSALEHRRRGTGLLFFGLIQMDCADFNHINGTFGHKVGDALLIAIGKRLGEALNEDELLAHTGGDEFCVLLEKVPDHAALASRTNELISLFEQPFPIDGNQLYVAVSAGAALGNPDAYQTSLEVLRDADTAMYKAKRRGTGCFEIFDPAMRQASAARLALETDLRRALGNGREFCLHYQPIIDLTRSTIWGFEALVRWNHPAKGLLFPDSFIGCAEDTGLIVQLGRVVLEQACRQLAQWHLEGGSTLRMAVNLSARQFAHGELLDDLDAILRETGANPARLELEITETTLMENVEASIEALRALKARGIRLSLDDFGTGYSSLSYLQRFPIDLLKIDRCFVQALLESARDASLVEAVLGLSQAFDIEVIAEGIESESQLQKLVSLGARLGQGYFFSKPVPAGDASALIARFGCA